MKATATGSPFVTNDSLVTGHSQAPTTLSPQSSTNTAQFNMNISIHGKWIHTSAVISEPNTKPSSSLHPFTIKLSPPAAASKRGIAVPMAIPALMIHLLQQKKYEKYRKDIRHRSEKVTLVPRPTSWAPHLAYEVQVEAECRPCSAKTQHSSTVLQDSGTPNIASLTSHSTLPSVQTVPMIPLFEQGCRRHTPCP